MTLLTRIAGTALLIVFCDSPLALVAQEDNPEDVKRMITDDFVSENVYVGKDNEPRIRAMYDDFVEAEIQTIHQYCELTNAQRDKLRLAGKGDYAQWQKRIVDFRRRTVGKPLSRDDRWFADIELSFLRLWPTDRAIDRDCLLQKALKSSITTEQTKGYEAYRRAQRIKQLDQTWNRWEKSKGTPMILSKESRRALNEFFLENVDPLPGTGYYSELIILMQLKENQDQARSILSEEEWKQFESTLNTLHGMERSLRHFELWPVKVEKQGATTN